MTQKHNGPGVIARTWGSKKGWGARTATTVYKNKKGNIRQGRGSKKEKE